MLKSTPLHVQQTFATRGYGLACGLAVLLSSFGTTPPMASSPTSSLPFRRLEAGCVQGGGDLESYNFVLFQMPETYEYEISGSLGRSCLLPKPAKNFIIEKLDSLAGTDRATRPGNGASTCSYTTVLTAQSEKPLQVVASSTKSRQTVPQKTSESKQPHQPQPRATDRGSGRIYALKTSESRQPHQPQPGVTQIGRYRAISSAIEEHQSSSLSDGPYFGCGPFGTRAISFLCAWSFFHESARDRVLKVVTEARPALIAGRIEGCNRQVLVEAAQQQDLQGGLFCLLCDRRAIHGLQHQLSQTQAVEFAAGKYKFAAVINDKTLFRVFDGLDWASQAWPDTADLESLEFSVTAFVQLLCHPQSLNACEHRNMALIRRLVQRVRVSFEGLLTASRNFLAFELLQKPGSAPPSRGCAALLSSRSNSSENAAWPKSRFQNRFCRTFTTARTEDEAAPDGGEGAVEADEALEEVRRSLRPVTQATKVEEALRQVDDFRKHEEFGKFSLHPHLRRELFKVHRNLNHPAKDVFLRALRHAGVRDDILQWVREYFTCPLCEASRKPLPSRPAHLAKTLSFNAIVAIDLFFLNLFGSEKVFLVCVDHGTGYVQVARCQDAKAATVRREMCRAWVQPFGVPELILCDQGPEFTGTQFQEHMSQLGAAIHYTDGASPWQNGKAERTVQTLKNKILLTIKDISAHEEEMDEVLAQVVSAYNSMFDRHGFTPDQRVFGRSVRMPASLLADDRLNQELLMESAGDAIQRTWDIRSAARQAWLKKDDTAAVQRAKRVQTRSTDVHSYQLHPGQWVYVWRRSDSRHGWTGPGSLIAQVPGGTSWWINVRGRLWKASAEQIRPASDEEDLGASLMIELHKDLVKQLRDGRQVSFQDITDEGGPVDIVEEELEELFGESAQPTQLGSVEVPPESSELRTPSLDGTTTIGDDHSVAPTPSVPAESRRQSVATAVPSGEDSNAPRAEHPGEATAVWRDIRVDEASCGTMRFGSIPSARGQTDRSQPYFTECPQLNPSNYMNVMDFDAAADATSTTFWTVGGPRWATQLTSGRSILKPLKPKTYFQISLAEASYCLKDRCMYVSKAKSSFGQVEFSKLQGPEKELFRKSRAKEFQSLLDNKAVRVLSVKESEEFRRLHPEAILESRFVDRYKPVGISPEKLDQARQAAIDQGDLRPLELSEDHTNPKSRWCVVGWKDPQIHQIERSAPTPSSASLNVVLQMIAARRWSGYLRDVKTAFLQSKPTDRRVPLACAQPRDEGLPGLDPRQLLLLLTEVYGLVSGPAWWRTSFLQKVYKYGFRLCPYEPCLLTLPGERPGEPTEGVLVIEVDDLVEAGSAKHRDKMKALEGELTFGKVVHLREASEQESTYAGRTLRQLKDYSFEMHMEEYIYTRLSPITLAKKTLKKNASQVPLDPTEVTQLRGVIAALSWVSRECRPDAAAAASILAACFPEPTVEHAMQANEVIRQLKQFPIRLRIHSIEESKVRNIVISDSAFDTSGKEKSQHGYFVGFTNDEMNLGIPAPISLTRWCSRRLRRKASSSMLCEAIAMSSATAALEKQDALWDALRFSFYDPRQRQRTEEETLELQGKSSVIASEAPLYRDPRSIAILDAKSLFDSLLSDQPSDCERTNLEIAVIRESLQVCRARARWVPHNKNPSDALTKFSGAHMEPLIKMLRTGRYQISDEEDVLKAGRQGLQRLKQGIGSIGNSSFLGAVKQLMLSWN